MEFNVNHPVLYVLVGIVIAVVLAQSVYFLVKSYNRAKQIGMDMKKIKKTILTAAIFTIAPAVSIVITILALSNSLGVALPWLDGLTFSILSSDENILLSWLVTLYHLMTTVT